MLTKKHNRVAGGFLTSMMAPMVRGAYPTSNLQLAFDRAL